MRISPGLRRVLLKTCAALLPALALAGCGQSREEELAQKLAAAEQDVALALEAKRAAERAAEAAQAEANQPAMGFDEGEDATSPELDEGSEIEGESDPYDNSFAEPQPMIPAEPAE